MSRDGDSFQKKKYNNNKKKKDCFIVIVSGKLEMTDSLKRTTRPAL